MAILTKTEVWRRPKVPRPDGMTPDLTDEERANIRRAFRTLRFRFGTYEEIAKALGTSVQSVTRACGARARPTVALAFRAARVLGVPVEDIISGRWPAAGACPTCGRGDAPSSTLAANGVDNGPQEKGGE